MRSDSSVLPLLALFGLLPHCALTVTPLGAQQPGVDVRHYRFALTLPDTGKRIEAASRITLVRSPGVAELRLDLLAPMVVSTAAVGCGAVAVPAPFEHDGKVVSVSLGASAAATAPDPSGPPARDSLCVTVTYAGIPSDGLVISTDGEGRWIAFGDNWPNRARHWLASVDHPSDKALVEFVVDAPLTRTVIANGTQRARRDVAPAAGRAARRVTTWATVAPIPTYLMVIAAAPLTMTALGETACGLGSVARCVPQSVFTAPEQARFSPGNFRFADDIVSYFSRTVEPFPYEQLAHVQSSTRFGGMENAGAIFYADRLFRTENGVSVGLIAHETAHQWFGNSVTEREWGHLWLSEGFATYFAALYTEHSAGDSAFRSEMEGIRSAILAAAVVAERPVIDTAQGDLLKLLNANSYQKGGFVLHMLRREVGDSAFFRAVRGYAAAHRHGNALTSDLQAAFMRESGRDLTWFFDQWLTRPGFPELSVSWTHDAATEQLAVTVVQGSRFIPFRFPLTIEIEATDGTRSSFRLDVPPQTTSRHVLREPIALEPRAIRVDPRVDLLAEIKTP